MAVHLTAANARAGMAWGVLGFGLGGLVGGFIFTFLDVMLFAYLVIGACGGAALAFAAGARDRAWQGAAAGAAGTFIGFFVPFLVMMTVWDPPFDFVMIGAGTGLVGGASMGLALRRRGMTGSLAVAGTLAFVVAHGLLEVARHLPWNPYASTPPTLLENLAQSAWVGLTLGVASAVAGALLGAVAARTASR